MTNFIDYFIPKALDDEGGIERKRARVAVMIAVCFMAWGPIIASLHWAGGSTQSAVGVVLCTVVVATSPFLLRATGRLDWAGHAIVLPLYALLIWTIFLLGGLYASSLSWLVLAPIFALLFQGRRTAVVWMVIVVLSWVGVAIAHWSGYGFEQQLSARYFVILRVVGVVGLGVSVFGMMVLKDSLQEWLVGQVRRKEAQTRAVLETAPDGILTVASGGEVLSANRAAARVFDDNDAALVGHSIGELVPSMDVDRLSEAAMSADDGQAQEHRARRGVEEFPAEISVGTLGDSPATLVLVVRDITERKEAKAKLERARDDALEASRAKSAFLANMSHELRTPLNAVIGYSEMIIEDIELMDASGKAADQFVPDLQRIRTAGKHLLSLINDILDLSKIEAGKTVVDAEYFDVVELIDAIVGTVRPMAKKNQNTIQIKADDDLKMVRSDVTKVRQILFNLISNACKFTSDGTVVLRAGLDETGRQLVFEVEDDGIGMSADQLEEVFDAFTQADASTTREFGGTGLGLTITNHFCGLLGGQIDVDSTLGKGSVFTVRLAADLDGGSDAPERLNSEAAGDQVGALSEA